ncbi:hypothetical protein [Glycomyces algeriensis]|uniref:Uncharacterized protein n=1 Tax=Glycomyces algeriensis TaxID=256037 RepID=A0A9W6LHP1_9ACTN|nr:hypothetical protein [Glycomyces algeriensis]MDA1365400.1 hypothetical protein [Glycomyces algeriensis]MDR7351085.1 hypothetical protein [Glycomyces algeriensis]GLI43798.1 hypothetical protein GALLR39Z86_36480 [Glycomyces algeriensis]
MELLLFFPFLLIAAGAVYWAVRLGVRDGIADADERRDHAGPED